MSRYLVTLLLAAACCCVQPEAQAQVNLPTVGVSGSRAAAAPRVDVSRACPGYAEQLRARLSLPEVDQASEMLVVFELEQGSVSRVGFQGAPFDFRRGIRSAVYRLDCAHDGEANQRFVFLLRHEPHAVGGTQAVALSAESPLRVALMD